MQDDLKRVLWENVAALMRQRWGKENLTRLAQEAQIGPGTAARMKAQETSMGLDVIGAVALALQCEPWQLLVPSLDPAAPPALGGDPSGWPMALIEKKRFTALPTQARTFVEGYLLRCIEEQEASGRTGTE